MSAARKSCNTMSYSCSVARNLANVAKQAGVSEATVSRVLNGKPGISDATRAVTCYAGRYELKDGEVHHHVEMALNPNMIGQTMIRRVHFDGPNLTLSARPDAQGQVRRIKWRRVESE